MAVKSYCAFEIFSKTVNDEDQTQKVSHIKQMDSSSWGAYYTSITGMYSLLQNTYEDTDVTNVLPLSEVING